jgi:hypothetical protein
MCCLFFDFCVCLHFVKINNVCLYFDKIIKGHQYGYQLKGLGLGSKNMVFSFDFHVFLRFVKINNSQLPLRDS